MSEPFIRARGLEHTYMAGTPLAVQALCGVDLDVWPGEAIGIIGSAGAGKSTLVQHLNGLLRPAARGPLWVDGRVVGVLYLDGPVRSRLHRGIFDLFCDQAARMLAEGVA